MAGQEGPLVGRGEAVPPGGRRHPHGYARGDERARERERLRLDRVVQDHEARARGHAEQDLHQGRVEADARRERDRVRRGDLQAASAQLNTQLNARARVSGFGPALRVFSRVFSRVFVAHALEGLDVGREALERDVDGLGRAGGAGGEDHVRRFSWRRRRWRRARRLTRFRRARENGEQQVGRGVEDVERKGVRCCNAEARGRAQAQRRLRDLQRHRDDVVAAQTSEAGVERSGSCSQRKGADRVRVDGRRAVREEGDGKGGVGGGRNADDGASTVRHLGLRGIGVASERRCMSR